MADVGGRIIWDLDVDKTGFDRDLRRASNQAEGFGQTAVKQTGLAQKGFLALAKVGIAAAIAAVAAIGVAIGRNLGSAIRRVDTLNNANRTFANMGFDAKVGEKAMEDLTKSILGLPTPLDSAVRGMTALAATYGDISKGQKVFTSLNNAILGFGGTAEMVDSAIMQLSQLPMDGPLDAQTWMSLRNSGLTPVLVAMAKESGTSVSAMKEAFGSGELTVKDFTDRLVKMNEKGGGGLKSLENIAKDSTKGIGTSFANMNTAITRGIGSIIEVIGSERIAGAITNFGASFEESLKTIARTISATINFIDRARSAFSRFWEFIKPLRDFIADQFQKAWDDLSASFESLKETLKPFLPQLKILGIILGIAVLTPLLLLLAALGLFIAIAVAVITVVARLIGWIARLGAQFVQGLVIVGRFVAGVVNFFRELPGRIVRAVGNLGNLLVNAGKDLIRGLISGVRSMFGAAVDSVNNIGSGIVSGFRRLLRIDSPSKVFMGIGQDISAGLVRGITQGQSEVQSAIGGLTGFSTGLETEISSSVTGPVAPITVNLDMSGVMTRSRSEFRDVAKDMIRAVDEELRAKQLPEIAGGSI